MSAAKHVLLRVWHKDAQTGESRPSKYSVIWEIDQWQPHRLELMQKYGDRVDEMFVITVGGLKRLKVLQKSLHRLEHS